MSPDFEIVSQYNCFQREKNQVESPVINQTTGTETGRLGTKYGSSNDLYAELKKKSSELDAILNNLQVVCRS
jgi:hypothetical protein